MAIEVVSGLNAETYKNLELNAGILLEGFDWSECTDAETFKTALNAFVEAKTGLLGATRGGGTFNAVPEMREPDIDGKRYRTKGLLIVDSWDVRLTGTLLEAYAGNFKRTMNSADVETTGKREVLTLRTMIEDTDYIDKMQWVSNLGDGSYMLIELDNVINLDGVAFTYADKNEGTIPVNFAATQADVVNQSKAPFRIVYFKN